MDNWVAEPDLGDRGQPHLLSEVGAPRWSALGGYENTLTDDEIADLASSHDRGCLGVVFRLHQDRDVGTWTDELQEIAAEYFRETRKASGGVLAISEPDRRLSIASWHSS